MAKTAWGIELGTTSVKAVKLSGDRGGVGLEDVGIISLVDFGLGAGTSLQDATAGALNELRSGKGIKKGDEVFVSISGQNTLGRIISLPPVPKERVRETIENEARSQIPIKLEEAVWDFQIIDDQDPDELRVNLYAAKKDVVEEIVGMCDMAGLHITGVQVAPLGIYNFIKYEMDDAVSDSCVAIDIGAENTDVIIIDGQKTYVRVVPVAGNDITKALRARFKLQIDDAEKLKRRAHKSKDAAAVFEAMKPPLKDMVGEIYRAVGFYKSQHDEANINQLVMMGNGSKLLNIKKFFEQQLQYQVHKVDTPVRIALARSVDPTEVQNNIQSLTVAIGLALQGLQLDEVNTINLIPPEYIERQGLSKIQIPFFGAGAIAAVGGLIAMLLAIFATAGLDTEIADAVSLASSASQRKAAVTAEQPSPEDQNKAYSLINLSSGNVGVLAASKAKDDEEQAADVTFTMRADEAGPILSKATIAALAEYAARTEPKPKTDIYYANFNITSLNGSLLTRTSTLLQQKDDSAWVGAVEGEGGHYVATRTISFRVWVASRLGSGVGADSAQKALSSNLAEDDTGLLWMKLRAALIDELRKTGQLEGIEDDQLDDIDFSKHLNVNVTEVSSTLYNNKGKILLGDIVSTSGVGMVVKEKVGDIIKERPPKTIRNAFNDTEFAVSEVNVTLTLTPVQAPSGEEG